jgi:phospho-N-acetylmuramoyl-pentapeptide-transferase
LLYHLHEAFPWLAFLRHAEFRALLAAITAFLIAVGFGRWFIRFLKRREVLERTEKGDSAELRVLHGHKSKTPTMGGVILLFAVLVSTLMWTEPGNRLVLLVLGLMLAFGCVGFVDDMIKLRSSRKGLTAKTKFLWQVILAGIVGMMLYFDPLNVQYPFGSESAVASENPGTTLFFPFFENVYVPLGVLYVVLVVLVTTGASNAVNLTDGLDGLAIGCSILVGVTFVTVALLAGHAQSSLLLGIPHVVGSLEVAVFTAALVGAGLGFLWFNCHPAQIFMGDTGALALGGSLGLIAVLCKQEILLVFAGGVLVAEAMSVILQVTSFKLTGKRIFRCAPLHHHFEFKGWAETKVTVRFWIAAAVLSFGSLLALRL